MRITEDKTHRGMYVLKLEISTFPKWSTCRYIAKLTTELEKAYRERMK